MCIICDLKDAGVNEELLLRTQQIIDFGHAAAQILARIDDDDANVMEGHEHALLNFLWGRIGDVDKGPQEGHEAPKLPGSISVEQTEGLTFAELVEALMSEADEDEDAPIVVNRKGNETIH